MQPHSHSALRHRAGRGLGEPRRTGEARSTCVDARTDRPGITKAALLRLGPAMALPVLVVKNVFKPAAPALQGRRFDVGSSVTDHHDAYGGEVVRDSQEISHALLIP